MNTLFQCVNNDIRNFVVQRLLAGNIDFTLEHKQLGMVDVVAVCVPISVIKSMERECSRLFITQMN